ncbi:MAG: DUF2304 domain-containing protein [Eubacterium sp.]|nr:DUF2304 domain-containing protein [Eubacterium sp.]
MSDYLRVLLGIVVVLYFYLVIHFVKKKTLALKYTLLWIFAGFAMGVLVVFPQGLELFVRAVGIETPTYGLFLTGIFFSLLISMSLTAIVSRQTERIKDLAQANAILEKRVRELESNVQSGDKKRGKGVESVNHYPGLQ